LQVDTVKESYAKHTNKWNVASMIAVGGALYGLMAFFVASEINTHRNSDESHPAIVSQLKDIRSDQIKERILKMDERICDDPTNVYYKQELIRLISDWETIKKPQKFPFQLLRCSK
jgi:hypothetical protein